MANYFSLKAVLLGFTAGLALMLLNGCLNNSPANMDASFSGEQWVYLNRGYPLPWAGLTLARDQVRFPLVQVPLLPALNENGTEFVKVIHLGLFIPILLILFAISYVPAFFIAQTVDKNKNLQTIFWGVNLAFVATAVYIYFSLFPRI